MRVVDIYYFLDPSLAGRGPGGCQEGEMVQRLGCTTTAAAVAALVA